MSTERPEQGNQRPATPTAQELYAILEAARRGVVSASSLQQISGLIAPELPAPVPVRESLGVIRTSEELQAVFGPPSTDSPLYTAVQRAIQNNADLSFDASARQTTPEAPHLVQIDTFTLRPSREWAARNMPRIHPIAPDSLPFVELSLVVRRTHGFRSTVATGPDMNHLRVTFEVDMARRAPDWTNSYVAVLACPDTEPDAWAYDVIPIALGCLYCTMRWQITSAQLKEFQSTCRSIAPYMTPDAVHTLASTCPHCRREVATHLHYETLRAALTRRNREEGWDDNLSSPG